MSRWTTRTALATSVAPILVGLAVLVVSAWLPVPNLALFLVGAAVIGAGNSAMFKGGLAVVIGVSPPSRLAESLPALFLSG